MKRQTWMSADLNLLKAFSVLVAERSVAKAAKRLHISESAMSRTLSRVRDAFGDPILIRAGRLLIPTPRALSLEPRVLDMLAMAQDILTPAKLVDPASLAQTFTIRCNEGFAAEFGAKLLHIVTVAAPGVHLRFSMQDEKDATALRDDKADIEVGVLGKSGPEIRVQTLLRDRFVGVVAMSHPLAGHESVSIDAYTRYPHVSVSRRGRRAGPIDALLSTLGAKRRIAATVSSFPVALALAQGGSIVANVPFRQTASGRTGMHTFELPVQPEPVVVSMMWHPKVDPDPAHRWLRDCLLRTCAD